MFINATEIESTIGVTVTDETVRIAQVMIETWIGRSEIDVLDTRDRDIVARAVMWQAVYIKGNPTDMLEQAAVTHVSTGDMTTDFDTSLFSPFMAPLAVVTCRKLSWMGARSIHTGPLTGGSLL